MVTKWLDPNWHHNGGGRSRWGPLEPSALGGIGVIACYCRVSSARQKTDSQKPEIRRWLQGNGIDPATVEWFEDKETGGTLPAVSATAWTCWPTGASAEFGWWL